MAKMKFEVTCNHRGKQYKAVICKSKEKSCREDCALYKTCRRNREDMETFCDWIGMMNGVTDFSKHVFFVEAE